MKEPVKISLPRIRDYFRFLSWIIQDSIGQNKLAALKIVVTGFFGVAFQVQVFALIIYYARNFSTGETINIAGHTLDPRTSMELLLSGGVLVMLLLSLSALSVYFSTRSILHLGRLYEEYCARRIFYLLGRIADISAVADSNVKEESFLLKLVRMDSRFAGRVLRRLLSLIIPAFTLAAASIVLVYLEPLLTLIIAVLSLVFVYYQYKASKEAATFSVKYEKINPVSGRVYRKLIMFFKRQPINGPARDMIDRTFVHGPVKKQLDAFEGRLRAVLVSKLVSAVFTAMILGLIIIIMGAGIIREGGGWGRLLVYLVALRFAMISLKSCFGIFTSINRFYPQVRRYYLFVRGQEKDSPDKADMVDVYQIRPDQDKRAALLQDSAAGLTLAGGSRMSLVSMLGLNRYTLSSLAGSLVGESRQAYQSAVSSACYVTHNLSCPLVSMRRMLNLGPEAGRQDLEKWFSDPGIWDNIQSMLPPSLDRRINQDAWDGLSPGTKFIFSLISARNSDALWVWIEAGGIERIGSERARELLGLFDDRIVVVVVNKDLDLVGTLNEQAVAVVVDHSVLGIGPPEWFQKVRPRVEDLLGVARPDGAPDGGNDDDEDMME